MSLNIAIAIFLFGVSSLGTYVIWYIVRGRRKRLETQAPADKTEQKPEKEKKESGKPYSYPKINDVMGYDFVTVVDVPKELLSQKKEEKQWENAPAVGGLRAVSAEGRREDEDEIHETGGQNGYGDKGQEYADENEVYYNEEGEPVETVGESDMSMEILEAINSNQLANWNGRDDEDGYPEETFDLVLDNNRGMIEEYNPEDPDITSNARDIEQMRRMMMEDKAKIDEEETFNFSEMLDETLNQAEQEAAEEEQQEGHESERPDDSDIPDI